MKNQENIKDPVKDVVPDISAQHSGSVLYDYLKGLYQRFHKMH